MEGCFGGSDYSGKLAVRTEREPRNYPKKSKGETIK